MSSRRLARTQKPHSLPWYKFQPSPRMSPIMFQRPLTHEAGRAHHPCPADQLDSFRPRLAQRLGARRRPCCPWSARRRSGSPSARRSAGPRPWRTRRATALRRCAAFMPLSGGVGRTRRSRCCSTGTPHCRPRCLATSPAWLNPRHHNRRRCSGTGTRIGILAGPAQRRHEARHRPRQRDLAAIFQLERDPPRQRRHKPPRRASGRAAAARRGSARTARASVASSGMPQRSHPASPSKSSVSQHAAQKPSTSSMMSPHPAQRGGSAKSSTCPARLSDRRRAGSSPCPLVAWRAPSHKPRRERRPAPRPVRPPPPRAAPRPRRAQRPRPVPARARLRRMPRPPRRHPAPLRTGPC